MKKGFTLAEVLTTLMVVGIIASMLIPTVMMNVQQQKRKVMLKKLYSSYIVNIRQVLTGIDASSRDSIYHCSSLSCLRVFNKKIGANRVDISENEIANHKHNGILAQRQYFNVLREDMNLIQKDDIIPDMPSGNNWDIDGAGNDDKPSAYILNNSAGVIIYDYSGNCNTQIGDAGSSFNACGMIIFDVNGLEGPSKPCIDRYGFYIADKPFPNAGDINSTKLQASFLVPMGYDVTRDDFSGNNGYDCTGKILLNNWKMDK